MDKEMNQASTAQPDRLVPIVLKKEVKYNAGGKKNAGIRTTYEIVCLALESVALTIVNELNKNKPGREDAEKTTYRYLVHEVPVYTDANALTKIRRREEVRTVLEKTGLTVRAMLNLPDPKAPDTVIDAYIAKLDADAKTQAAPPATATAIQAQPTA